MSNLVLTQNRDFLFPQNILFPVKVEIYIIILLTTGYQKNAIHVKTPLVKMKGILSACNFWILCEINFPFFDFYTAFTHIENIIYYMGVYVLIGVFKRGS